MEKTIVITGATGFVGKKLCLELFLRGYKLRILCRSMQKAKTMIPLPVDFIVWNGKDTLPSSVFEGTDGVIHLAGESVAGGRWTEKRKEKILESRTQTTSQICGAISQCQNPPPVMVGASAIGIYGDRLNESLSETSSAGSDFLARVCVAWEESYQGFKGRLVLLRTGVVLGHGGALEKMLLPFRLGAGGRLASGDQWMSWIHLDDLVKMYIFSLENPSLSGAMNAVAPRPVTNKEFTKELGLAVKMPAVFPVPRAILKLVFGEMSSILLASQKVVADKIIAAGFTFTYPGLAEALRSILSPGGKSGCSVFSSYQWLPLNKEAVFKFFSQAENLEVITPPWVNFKILKMSDDKIKEGTLIDYKLKIKGVPASWKTLIRRWSPPNEFTDDQVKGPYTIWSHTHRFMELQGGTLMTDEVIYKAPFGPIGHIVNEVMIRSDVAKIFNYRTFKIHEVLPK